MSTIVNFVFQNGHQHGRYLQNGRWWKMKSSDFDAIFLYDILSTSEMPLLTLFFKIATNMAAIFKMAAGGK